MASSSASLTTYFQAKWREGVLSHFLSHVGLHFRKDFLGPELFDEDVLAKAIAASHEDFLLDAQLSITKAFTLLVFGMPGILTERPPLIRNLRRLLPLPLFPEVPQNHGEGSARLPLVRIRIVL